MPRAIAQPRRAWRSICTHCRSGELDEASIADLSPSVTIPVRRDRHVARLPACRPSVGGARRHIKATWLLVVLLDVAAKLMFLGVPWKTLGVDVERSGPGRAGQTLREFGWQTASQQQRD